VIKLTCDNCEKPFEVDDDLAGGKTPCPFCDDVNRVPGGGAATPAGSSPGGAVSGGEGEREICIVRPAMFRARPWRYLFIVLLIAGGFVLAAMARWGERVPGWLMWPGLVIGVLALGWFGIWWLSTHFWIRLVVTNMRSVRHEGIVKRHTTEVLHDHIRSVDIRQTLLNRVLNVGDVDIDSAGQAGDRDIEISMRSIPRPYVVKKIIDQYRRM